MTAPIGFYAQVPVGNELPWYKFQFALSAQLYTLHVRYNTRSSRWILDIADSQNNDILDSIPLLIGRQLNTQYIISELPVGIFYVTDDTGQGNQPTRNSFGLTHTLWYYDPTGGTGTVTAVTAVTAATAVTTAVGDTGPAGPRGPMGAEGPPGPPGAGGHMFYIADSTGWDGTATSVTYDVSSVFSDATMALWGLQRASAHNLQILCDIDFPSATHVRVTVDIPLTAGTYNLLGIGVI